MDFSQPQKISRRKSIGSVPLSFAQQRLWFLNQLELDNPSYNICAGIRFSGLLNVTALEQTLTEIVRRHEALRTTFATVDGQPSQVIAPDIALTVPLVDLWKLSEPEREAETQRLVTEECRRAFDLVQGPLLHAKLLCLTKDSYILLVTLHQIVSDATSFGVFFRELAALYEALSTGKPSPIPELPIQYADFAVWQRQWLQGEALKSQLDYWKKQLDGNLPLLQLPTDHPRPLVQTYRGASQSLVLPNNLTKALKALSRQEEVTLFMTLLATLQTLLYRYSGLSDIIVGSPMVSRNRVETERLIGCFVNTLVMRTNLSDNPSFRELLGRVRGVVLGAYAHQDLPFEKLVEELQPERNLSYTPLFLVMFVLQETSVATLELSKLRLSPLELYTRMEQFDLILSAKEIDEGIVVFLEYNAELFEATTISQMLEHFQTLLGGIVAHPTQRLSELPLLTQAERHQLLVEWNPNPPDYPKDLCLHQPFEIQVERRPDAVAVVIENEQLTYRELNCRANQLAHYLRKLGVGPEIPVGVYIERSLELAVGIIGILKAGGVCVPLDPEYPKERLAFMLEDAQVSVLLTQKGLLENIPHHKGHVLCIDTSWETITQESTEPPVTKVTAENLAYIFYTSGSTGKPKGVMISHLGRCREFWEQTAYQLTETDRRLIQTSSLLELFGILRVGGQGIIVRPGKHRDSAYLTKVIAEHKITEMSLIPSMLEVFLEEPGLDHCNCLKHVSSGAEAWPIGLQERFFNRLSASLHHTYGLTELSSYATLWNCKGGSNQPIMIIGHPVAGMKVYLLDSNLQLVPIGLPGELYISSIGLARGYLNQPELTAEKFIPNPFSDEPGARMFKTGDLARFRLDGTIEFLGRLDNQVKIRGFRIELEEIEAVISQHPAVRKTAVIDRENGSGDKRLVAYVVSNQKQAPTIDELRCFLKRKLPEYMMQSAFVMLDALPLTPNGKLDRHALPASDQLRPDQSAMFVAPRTPIEQRIADICAQALGLEQVGVHDNFFELGGHSLLATQLISRLRQTFGMELPLRTLFEAPTVAELGDRIETIRWASQQSQAPVNDTTGDYEEGRL